MNNLVRRIEQIKSELTQQQYHSIGENAMIKVHEIIAMLNFPDAPLIPNLRQESTSSLMINNNITVTEIEEPLYDN
jgi:hypothetical protein